MAETFMIHNPAEMQVVARFLLSHFPSNRIITLYGDLGAGKTTLVRAFGELYGIEDEISSPTFSLVNEYRTEKNETVYHLDLYRIDTIEEALGAGIEEYLYTGSYCFIEWPEIIEPLFPADTLKIKIEGLDKSLRKVLIL